MIQKNFIFLFCCCFVFIAQVNAISDQDSSSTDKSPVLNGITQAAVQVGVLTCSSRINQIASFLTDNSKSGAFLFYPPKAQADKAIFSASVEIDPDNAPAMYASASFSPNVSNGCGAVYDTVEYVNNSCPRVAKSVFKDGSSGTIIKKDIVVKVVDNIKFFLMPAGQGCVVIKKEVIS